MFFVSYRICFWKQIHHGKFFCTEYEKSKAVADKIALEAASEGVPIVAVYPGVVYGPGKVTAGNTVTRLVRDPSLFTLAEFSTMKLVPTVV